MKKTVFLGISVVLLVVIFFFIKNYVFQDVINYDLSEESLGSFSLNDSIETLDENLLEEVQGENIKYKKIYIYDNKIELATNEEGIVKRITTELYYKGNQDKLQYGGVKTSNQIEIGDPPNKVLEQYSSDCIKGKDMGMGEYYRYIDKYSQITFWFDNFKEGINNITLEEL